MTIGARSSTGETRFDVVNPATGLAFDSAPICSEIQLEEAVQAALQAFPKWRRSEMARRNALMDCAQAIKRHLEELATLITTEQGKPISEARSEVAYAAGLFEQHASMPIPRTVLGADGPSRTLLVQRPIGVVGLITPWNFPVGTAAVKLAPALLMGNTVVLKPSPLAPLACLQMAKILRRYLPAGTLNAVSGGPELGALIASHPSIPKVSLTGSTGTGKAVMRLAAEELKCLTLELGGNDPAIILPDADPRQVAPCILDAAWRNAGQVCSAIKRVYVHESIAAPLVAALVEKAQAHRLGDGLLSSTTMGPLTTADQLDRMQRFAQAALDSGGAVSPACSPTPDAGYFFAPCIATGLGDAHPLVADEQFGPILPILTYRYIEDAIARSNDSTFGLSASVWTSNPNLGYEVAAQLECGRVGVNGHRRGDVHAPFGGVKRSGIGRELGEWGLLAMSESQVINVFG